LIIAGLSSCVSLQKVNDFSSTSSKGIKEFEEINYSFKQHCIYECQFDSIRKFVINRETGCHCDNFAKADNVTLLIYNAIKGYFDGLTNLSNKDLTNYNFDALKKSLTEGTFGNIKIDKNHVDAYSALSKILLKASTDIYRKKKLIEYIEDANAPIQILLSEFQFIIQNNLRGELDFKREKLYTYYKNMINNNTLTDYEKGMATTDYYQQLLEVTTKQNQIDAFAKSLKSMAEGHQKLYENRNKMQAKEVKELLTGYASDIQDIISEFNKLKK
jgi:hypothetical protein